MGRIAEGRRELAEALICKRNSTRLYVAELLRVDAELIAASGAADGAEARFREAMNKVRPKPAAQMR
jgi:hypothetical protein